MSFVSILIRKEVKKKTGFDSLIKAKITCKVKEDKTTLEASGLKDGKRFGVKRDLVGDSDGADLRKLFVVQAGKIPGEVDLVILDFDYEKNTSEAKAYYTHKDTGEKLIKHYTI